LFIDIVLMVFVSQDEDAGKLVEMEEIIK